MADHAFPEGRSRIMAGVGNKDTKPEMALRRAFFALGYRYRLHSLHLTGRPDLALPARLRRPLAATKTPDLQRAKGGLPDGPCEVQMPMPERDFEVVRNGTDRGETLQGRM